MHQKHGSFGVDHHIRLKIILEISNADCKCGNNKCDSFFIIKAVEEKQDLTLLWLYRWYFVGELFQMFSKIVVLLSLSKMYLDIEVLNFFFFITCKKLPVTTIKEYLKNSKCLDEQ